ncbi:hypothetical protein Psi01_70410 [Planobispora siamensis]|uniref:Uncharacterized protein n=1 Tax=Planobispora siamensis TaxID=936338 RepID=A0A8J3SPM6_9ACTN|nr:hypothetical protein Psi01_70410 [Planobispora siamensis]
MKDEPSAVCVPPAPGSASSPPQAAAEMARDRPAITAADLRRGIPSRRMLHTSSPSCGRVTAAVRTPR